MKHSILDITTLPKFTEMRTKEIEPAIIKIIEGNKKEINSYLLSEKDIEWNSFIKNLKRWIIIYPESGHQLVI